MTYQPIETEWSHDAYRWLRVRLRWQVRPFTAEELLPAVLKAAGEPRDRRQFGAVLQRLHREGYIARAGFRPARTSHYSPKPVWSVVRQPAHKVQKAA